MYRLVTLLVSCLFVVSVSAEQRRKGSDNIGVYQIPNGDFEMNWTNANEPGNGFHSFAEASGNYKSMVSGNASKQCNKAEGYNSPTSCKLESYDIGLFSAYANGNLTTGNIVAGATVATDKKNHNETQRNNSKGCLRFAGYPDSLSFYYKFFPGKIKGGSPNKEPGRCQLFIHGDVDFRDQEENYDNEGLQRITKYQLLKNEITMPAVSEWTNKTHTLTYYNPTGKVEDSPRYLLLSMATCAKASYSYEDTLYVDEVKFIYNSQLESLSINGSPVSGFKSNVYEYSIDGGYVEGSVEYSFLGDGAKIGADATTSYDSSTKKLTITVKGNDFSVNPSNYHTYTLTFVTKVIETHDYSSNMIVTVGSAASVNNETQEVSIKYWNTMTADLTIKSLTIGGKSYGDVEITGIPYKKSGTNYLLEGAGSSTDLGTVTIKATDNGTNLTNATFTATVNSSSVTMEYNKEYTKPVELIKSGEFSGSMTITVAGGVPENVSSQIVLADYYDNGKANITIKSLSVNGSTAEDIVLTDLDYTETSEKVTISGTSEYKATPYTVDATAKTYTVGLTGTVSYKNRSKQEIVLGLGQVYVPKITESGEFTDNMMVTVGTTPANAKNQVAKIDLYDDKSAVLTLKSLSINGEDLGDVVISGYKYTKSNGVISLTGNAVALIGNSEVSVTTSNCSATSLTSGLDFEIDMSITGVGDVKLEYSQVYIPPRDIVNSGETVSNMVYTNGTTITNTNSVKVNWATYSDGTMDIDISGYKLGTQTISNISIKALPYVDGNAAGTVTTKFGGYGNGSLKMISAGLTGADNTLQFVADCNVSALGDFKLEFNYVKKIKSVDFTSNIIVSESGLKPQNHTSQKVSIDIYSDDRADMIIDKVICSSVSQILTFKNLPLSVGTDSVRIDGTFTSEEGSEVDIDAAYDLKYSKMQIDAKAAGITSSPVSFQFGYTFVAPDAELVSSETYSGNMTTESKPGSKDMGDQTITVSLYDDETYTITVPAPVYIHKSGSERTLSSFSLSSLNPSKDGDKTIFKGTCDSKAGTVSISVAYDLTIDANGKMEGDLVLNSPTLTTLTGANYLNIGFGHESSVDPNVPVIVPPVLVKSVSYKDMTVSYVAETAKDTVMRTVKIEYYDNKKVNVFIDELTVKGVGIGDIEIDSIDYADNGSLISIDGKSSAKIGSTEIPAEVVATAYLSNDSLVGDITLDVVGTAAESALGTPIRLMIGRYVAPKLPVLVKNASYSDNIVYYSDNVAKDTAFMDMSVSYYDNDKANISINGHSVKGVSLGNIRIDSVAYATDGDSIRLTGITTTYVLGETVSVDVVLASDNEYDMLVGDVAFDFKDIASLSSKFGNNFRIMIGKYEEPVGPVDPIDPTDPNAVTVLSTQNYRDSLIITVDGEEYDPEIQTISIRYYSDSTAAITMNGVHRGDSVLYGDIVVKGLTFTQDKDSFRINGVVTTQFTSSSSDAYGPSLGDLVVKMKSAAVTTGYKKLKGVATAMTANDNLVKITFGYPSTPKKNENEEANRPAAVVITEKEYRDSLIITVDGEEYTPVLTSANVQYYSDSTVVMSLKGVKRGDNVLYGDIVLKGLRWDSDGDSLKIIGSSTSKFVPSSLAAVGDKLGDLVVSMKSAKVSPDTTNIVVTASVLTMDDKVAKVTFGVPSTPKIPEPVVEPATLVSYNIYTDYATITNGGVKGEPVQRTITVSYYDDNTVSFYYPDYQLDEMLLGDIEASGLAFTENYDSIHYSGTTETYITTGSEGFMGDWFGEYKVTVVGATDYDKKKLRAKLIVSNPDLGESMIEFGYYEEPVIDIPDDTVPEPEKVIVLQDLIFTDTLQVNVNESPFDPSEQTLNIKLFDNNYSEISLKNLILSREGDTMLVGDVVVDSLPYSDDAEFNTVIQGFRYINITSDNIDAQGPMFNNIPVRVQMATIDSDYESFRSTVMISMLLLGQEVDVKFGYPVERTPIDTVPTDTIVPVTSVALATYNDYARSYMKGDSTILEQYQADIELFSDNLATLSLKGYTYKSEVDTFEVEDIVVDSLKYTNDIVKGFVIDDYRNNVSVKANGSELKMTARLESPNGEEFTIIYGYEVPKVVPVDTIPKDTVPADTVPNIPIDTVPNIPHDTVPSDTIIVPAELVSTASFADYIQVTVDGEKSAITYNDAKVDYFDNNLATITIYDFIYSSKSTTMKIGNIVVDSVPYRSVSDSMLLDGHSKTQFVTNASGSFGQYLGSIPLSVTAVDSASHKLQVIAKVTDGSWGNNIEISYGYVEPVPEPIDSSKINPFDNLNTEGPSVVTASYYDMLYILVDGESTEGQMQKIDVTYNLDNTATLAITGFSLGEGANAISVGDIVVTGIRMTKTDSIRMSGRKLTTITSDDPAAIGPGLGEIPVNVVSAISSNDYSKLLADIDIDMGELACRVKFGYKMNPDTVLLLGTKEYTDSLVISVDGESSPAQFQNIQVDYYDNGLAKLSIVNFKIGEGENAIIVGDIVLDSVPYKSGLNLTMATEKIVNITSDDPAAIGPGLGDIPVKLVEGLSSPTFDGLYINLDIDMGELSCNVKFGYEDSVRVDGTGVRLLSTIVYTEDMYILYRNKVTGPMSQAMEVEYYSDSTCIVTLRDFFIKGEDSEILIGDIRLENLTFGYDGKVRMSGDGIATVSSENPEALAYMVSESKMTLSNAIGSKDFSDLICDMTLDLTELFGKTVTIHYGYFGFEDAEDNDGIEEVLSVKSKEDKRVFTVTGVYLGEDIDMVSLPKGIYIKGGKKVIVK